MFSDEPNAVEVMPLLRVALPSDFILLEPGDGQVKTVQLPCWRNYLETGTLDMGRSLGERGANVPVGSAEGPVT